MSFKHDLEPADDLRGGNTSGLKQCTRSTRSVLFPFSTTSGNVRWRHSWTVIPDQEEGGGVKGELKFAPQPWSFQDLFDDVVPPANSYDTQPLQLLEKDAALAAAQMEAFAGGSVRAAAAVAAKGMEGADHSSNMEAPPLAPFPSNAGHTPTPSDEDDVADVEPDSAGGNVAKDLLRPPVPSQRQQDESADTLSEEEREDDKKDEARP